MGRGLCRLVLPPRDHLPRVSLRWEMELPSSASCTAFLPTWGGVSRRADSLSKAWSQTQTSCFIWCQPKKQSSVSTLEDWLCRPYWEREYWPSTWCLLGKRGFGVGNSDTCDPPWSPMLLHQAAEPQICLAQSPAQPPPSAPPWVWPFSGSKHYSGAPGWLSR